MFRFPVFRLGMPAYIYPRQASPTNIECLPYFVIVRPLLLKPSPVTELPFHGLEVSTLNHTKIPDQHCNILLKNNRLMLHNEAGVGISNNQPAREGKTMTLLNRFLGETVQQ